MSDMLSATANIPLHCNICPKKPDFSDVSHLLTHVASKGHLSNYYKMKVRASTDPGSKRLVDNYDEWYEEWNLEDLMRERMSQKERKKGMLAGANGNASSRRGSEGTAPNPSTSRGNTPVVTNLAGRRRRRRLREAMLDPQLDRRVKLEPQSRSATPAPRFALDVAALSRSYAPPMQSWPDTPYAPSSMTQDQMDEYLGTPSSESVETEPPRRRGNRNKQIASANSNVDDGRDISDQCNDNSKLKGVYWDGMSIFDSATPEMRRKRNQKKAVSVVQRLKNASERIEPTELVFDADGCLRRARLITGNSDNSDPENSPLKGESTPEPDTPPPKKKTATRKTRQVLTERDVNSGRLSRRSVRDSHHPSFGGVENRRSYFDGPDDEDDGLTYGRRRPSARLGLSIHRDNSGPDITFSQPTFSQPPMPMDTLTSAFRNPFPQQGMPNQDQQTYQNGYFGGDGPHRRQSSFTFNAHGNFRPASNDGYGMSSVGSFGQLNGMHSIFQNSGYQTNPFASVHNGYASFQNQPGGLGAFPQPFGGQAKSMFQQHCVQTLQQQAPQASGTVSNSNHNIWDVFSIGAQDPTVTPAAATAIDAGFSGSADFASLNPLFFSSTHALPDDDDDDDNADDNATVSPPQSEPLPPEA